MNIARTIKGALYYTSLKFRCRNFPEKESIVEIDGMSLHCYIRGPQNGKPVILLHGNGSSHKSMRTQAMELALKGYCTYSPDSRGQGANEPLEEYHYSDMAEDTFKLIGRLGLEKPAVFGWSDGGIIILMLEIAHPGTCSMFVAAGANLTPECGDDFEAFKEWVLAQNKPVMTMMLTEPDIKPEELHKIKCPALLTVGEHDLISVEHTKLIADNIAGSRMKVFAGADHGSYIKNSPDIGRSILEFFASNDF